MLVGIIVECGEMLIRVLSAGFGLVAGPPPVQSRPGPHHLSDQTSSTDGALAISTAVGRLDRPSMSMSGSSAGRLRASAGQALVLLDLAFDHPAP